MDLMVRVREPPWSLLLVGPSAPLKQLRISKYLQEYRYMHTPVTAARCQALQAQLINEGKIRLERAQDSKVILVKSRKPPARARSTTNHLVLELVTAMTLRPRVQRGAISRGIRCEQRSLLLPSSQPMQDHVSRREAQGCRSTS